MLKPVKNYDSFSSKQTNSGKGKRSQSKQSPQADAVEIDIQSQTVLKTSSKSLKDTANENSESKIKASDNSTKQDTPQNSDRNEITRKTSSKKKKIEKHKKKRTKSPPSELDKELKDAKDETDDLIYRNRTKFTLTTADVTFEDVAGNNGKY